jgi:transposase
MSDAGMQGADGGERRRRSWSADQKQRIIAESFAPGASVAEVARRYGLNSNMADGTVTISTAQLSYLLDHAC